MLGVVAVVLVAVFVLLWVAREPLGERFAQGTERSRLLTQADAALRAGELTRADGRGARELYLAVLALDPDHAGARQGLVETGRAALDVARRADAGGDTAQGDAMIELARELSVPEAEIGAFESGRRTDAPDEEALAVLLARIQNQLRGRTAGDALPLVLPIFDEAMTMAPDNPVVASTRTRLLGEVLEQARALIRAGELEQAQALVDEVARVEPAHAGLPGARGQLAEARQAQATRRVVAPMPPMPVVEADQRPVPTTPSDLPLAGDAPTVDDEQLQVMLATFERALQRQEFLDPPGDSAWDRLRRLRAATPNDPRVVQAQAAFRNATRDCFEQHVATPRLSAAEHCLQALETLDPGAREVPEFSHRLASRWLGLAEERLGAAQIAGARQAFDAARARDPAHPGLPAMAARLERAEPR